jgi:carotenoid cleavage dioxygenase-like enzyme
MPTVLPVGSDVDVAVSRAVAARRERHLPHLHRYNISESLLGQLVVGVPAPLSRGRDDWWLVGYVIDGISGDTFEVWLFPGCRTISGVAVTAAIHE